MLHRFIVAIGAGCAAALLFAVSAQSSVLAMALAYVAPLPIMIATLGWGLDAGAIAGAISIAVLAVVTEPLSRTGVRDFGRGPGVAFGRVRSHADRAISARTKAGRSYPRVCRRRRFAGGPIGNTR